MSRAALPSALGLALTLAIPADAGTTFICNFDSQCLFDEGCAMFDAPIHMMLELGGDGGGAARFDHFRDSFTASVAALPHAGPASHYTLTGDDVVGLITIEANGKAMLSRHSVSDAEYGALYSGFCRRP